MTNTTVAEPASKPESQGAPNAADPQTPSPLASGEAPNSADGGTGGEQANAAPLQTGNEQAIPAVEPPVTPPAPAIPAETDAQREQRLLAKINADQAEQTRRDNLTRTNNELRALRRDGGETARELLNKLEEAADVRLAAEIRKPFLDWVETLNGKSLDAARLEVTDDRSGSVETARNDVLQEVVQGFYDAVPKDQLPAFQAAVKGKPIEEWVNASRRFGGDAAMTAAAVSEDRTSHDAEFVALMPEAKREAFAAELKAAKTPKARAAVLEKGYRAVGRSDPATPPNPAEGAGGGNFNNMREVRTAHARREISTQQMREYQAQNQRGSFPD